MVNARGVFSHARQKGMPVDCAKDTPMCLNTENIDLFTKLRQYIAQRSRTNTR